MSTADDLAAEQDFITTLYGRLDGMRRDTMRLRDTYLRDSDGTPGGRVQRDIAYAGHAQTLIDLNVAEDKLCFGRLDSTNGDSMHIGRMGIFSDGVEREQLLMDWRAPSARPFYVATAAAPLGVRLRRHLRVRRRVVDSLSDEYLDLTGLSPDDPALAAISSSGLTGEAALLAALNAPRTGRMGDIVETIQAEQDRIIRADRAGILVVQGGPGTGKTAVALHRTAYLLYTHRQQLANRGVLVIGPNRTFLNYIGQVLPSLGENAVVLSTIGDLFPGVRATRAEAGPVAVLKGRLSMAKGIANAVLDRQRVPKTTIELPYGGGTLRLDHQLLSRAQQRAWQSRRPHNPARNVFLKSVFDQLTRQVARRQREGLASAIPMTGEDFEDVRRDLRADEQLQAVLARIWPLLTANELVGDLLSSARRLRVAAPFLGESDRELLLAASPGRRQFSQSDVPLLDEAAELLGEDADPDDSEALRAEQERRERAYAVEVLESLGLEGSVDAAQLVGRYTAPDAYLTTAERAADDREWAFGHVVVDEAQELSAMAWRAVMRRCPTRSMTLVGDVAQTGTPAGASSWGEMLAPYVQDRWRLSELTVNYRTPTEVMDVAGDVLAALGTAGHGPGRSVREAGERPYAVAAPAGLGPALADVVGREAAAAGDGRLAVLVARGSAASIGQLVRAAVPAAAVGPGAQALDAPVAVLEVADSKGLEFDGVVLVEPAAILAASPRGLNDLYVALTRTTRRLAVVHNGPLPDVLRRLA